MTIAYLLTILLGLIPLCSAHMFIQQPPPLYVGPDNGERKSPLRPDGSNFPCKIPAGFTALPSSGGPKITAGKEHVLQFDRSATAAHGGGSCQISITYETELAMIKKASSWYVILSVQGGCPTNADGNLQAGANGINWCSDTGTDGVNCLNEFPYTIPEDFPSGHATLAWTWFNRVGAREMYMNCAPIEIVGGRGGGLQKYPELFTAEIDSAEGSCGTAEGANVIFPNPGPHLTSGKGRPKAGANVQVQQFRNAPPTGNCGSQARNGIDATGETESSEEEFNAAGDGDQPTEAYDRPNAPSQPSRPARVGDDLESSNSYEAPEYENPADEEQQDPPTPDRRPRPTRYRRPPKQSQSPAEGYSNPGRPNRPKRPKKGRVKVVTIYSTVTAGRSSGSRSRYGSSKDKSSGQYGSESNESYDSESSSGSDSGSTSGSTSGSGSGAGDGATSGRSGSGSNSTSGNSGAGSGSCRNGVSCSTPGQMICIDATHFGLCDLNKCAVSQSVAAGTQCKNGAIGFADGYLSSKKRRDVVLSGRHGGFDRWTRRWA